MFCQPVVFVLCCSRKYPYRCICLSLCICAGPNIVTDYEAILSDVILGKIESERQLTFILNPVFYQLHGYISEDCCICI